MNKLSVVIPMYNEEKVIDICYKRIKDTLDLLDDYIYEIIFINDGSKDSTFNILEDIASRDKNVKIISFSRNFGHQAAVIAGLRQSKGDAVIVIDSDLQDPPELIFEMLKLWREGNKVVIPTRKSRHGETKFKIYTAKLFYKLINKLSDIDLPENAGDFRLLDRQVVDCIVSLPEHNKYLRGLYSYVGFKQTKIDYVREKRIAGKTKYSLSKMIKLALDGIISFSNRPLKIVGIIGVLAIFIAFIIFLYAIISYVIKGDSILSGWTSMIITMVFFSGVQLLSLWIIAEYIARIYDDTKRRPEYIIEKKINFDK